MEEGQPFRKVAPSSMNCFYVKHRAIDGDDFDFAAYWAILATDFPQRVIDLDLALAVFDGIDEIEGATHVLSTTAIQ